MRMQTQTFRKLSALMLHIEIPCGWMKSTNGVYAGRGCGNRGHLTYAQDRFDATDCSRLQHTATHCNALQHATHFNTLKHIATRCNTLQHTATHCNALQRTATHCNTLQHTATHCNTLQHTATHCNTQHAVPNCNTLQHTRASYMYTRSLSQKASCSLSSSAVCHSGSGLPLVRIV